MPNPEHVKLLAAGEEALQAWWNSGRGGLDLRGADLQGRRFSGLTLFDSDFTGATLAGATFVNCKFTNSHLDETSLESSHASRCDFNNAHFRGANLTGAYLVNSEFDRGDFTDSRLVRANLAWTKLRRAQFVRADLTSAILQQADAPYSSFRFANVSAMDVDNTVFAASDFSGAVGLTEIHFRGPCIIDHEAVSRSGELPVSFLRGCGLPDEVIGWYESLAGAIRYYSCFISYSSQDQDFANRLHADLQNNGIRTWLSTEDLKIGDRFRAEIDEAIRLHDKLLLVLSALSISSAWVESEVETAMERERRTGRKVLFPVRLDDAVMSTDTAWAAEIRRTRHIGDFSQWTKYEKYQKSFERLIRDLKVAERGDK